MLAALNCAVSENCHTFFELIVGSLVGCSNAMFAPFRANHGCRFERAGGRSSEIARTLLTESGKSENSHFSPPSVMCIFEFLVVCGINSPICFYFSSMRKVFSRFPLTFPLNQFPLPFERESISVSCVPNSFSLSPNLNCLRSN